MLFDFIHIKLGRYFFRSTMACLRLAVLAYVNLPGDDVDRSQEGLRQREPEILLQTLAHPAPEWQSHPRLRAPARTRPHQPLPAPDLSHPLLCKEPTLKTLGCWETV